MSDKAEALFWEGHDLMMRAEYAQAEEKFAEAITFDNRSPQLYYNLGKVQAFQDKYREAEAALLRAIVLDQGYVEAYALLAAVYAQDNRLSEAASFFITAHGMVPEEDKEKAKPYLAALGHVKLLQGDYRKGFELYENRQKMEGATWDGTESLVGKTLYVRSEEHTSELQSH